jgi:hypothetical protein
MALKVDRNRHTGDVARHRQDLNCQRRGSATQAHRADSKFIDSFQEFNFNSVPPRITVTRVERPQQRSL